MLGWLQSLARKALGVHSPAVLAGPQWTGTGFVDAYKRNRAPTPNETLAELKNVAYTCASINAGVCASFPPRLFVWSADSAPQTALQTKSLSLGEQRRLKHAGWAPQIVRTSKNISEVTDHPLLDLLNKVNPVMNAFDLWELTTFYQEVLGNAYWYVERDNLKMPAAFWIMPSQNMAAKRNPGSDNLVDFYEYRVGATSKLYDPADIIHFRYPNPRDPYSDGLGPLRAVWEKCALVSDYDAFRKAVWENSGVPGAIVSPDEVIGEEERDRLEAAWNAKFRRGGAGRVLVAESGMRVATVTHSMGDLAALSEYKQAMEDIANAFHVPISYLSSSTNLANLEAAERQHLKLAIRPRLWRRDQKLNECLVPLYDPSGRLFLASDDPTAADVDQDLNWFNAQMTHGIHSINEVRELRGLEPVTWGNAPWNAITMAPMDWPDPHDISAGTTRADYYPTGRGRAEDPKKIKEQQQARANMGQSSDVAPSAPAPSVQQSRGN